MFWSKDSSNYTYPVIKTFPKFLWIKLSFLFLGMNTFSFNNTFIYKSTFSHKSIKSKPRVLNLYVLWHYVQMKITFTRIQLVILPESNLSGRKLAPFCILTSTYKNKFNCQSLKSLCHQVKFEWNYR